MAGYTIEGWLERDYLGALYTSYDSPVEALSAVSDGSMGVYIKVWSVSLYIIDENGISGLASSGPSGYVYDLSVGIDKEKPVLASIIKKALDSIPDEVKQQMLADIIG